MALRDLGKKKGDPLAGRAQIYNPELGCWELLDEEKASKVPSPPSKRSLEPLDAKQRASGERDES